MPTESFNLVINKNNWTNGSSRFTYTFKSGGFKIPSNSSISISSITIPYSWQNINAGSYQNNSFGFTWTTGTELKVFKYFLPNGNYSCEDINNYLHAEMFKNGCYLIDDNGSIKYFLNVLPNSTYYANQIISIAVPVSLPANFTLPSNFLGFPSIPSTPQFYFGSVNSGALLGFNVGYYPPTVQQILYQILSPIIPDISPVTGVVVRCGIVNNAVTVPPDILDSFSITANYGYNIIYQPVSQNNVALTTGNFSSFTITLTDQNNNELPILDANILLTLHITLNN